MRQLSGILAGLALLSAAGAHPLAAGPLVEILVARQAKLTAVLARHPGELPPTARDELQRALGEVLDFTALARTALGAEWERRSAAERREFAVAFEALLRASSIRSAELYRVDGVDYLQETVGDSEGEVRTSVRARGATTAMDYRFARSDGRWRVVDYAVDGVWAARSYRSQFTRILEKDGWAVLLERMARRTAELGAVPRAE